MRLYLAIIAITFLLGGCSSTSSSSTQVATNFIHRQHIATLTTKKYPPKNPQNIAVYTLEQKPLIPYRVIGVATVAKHNLIGMQRSDTTMHEMIKKLAASIGGDGLINIHNNNEGIQAHIIAYQRILL